MQPLPGNGPVTPATLQRKKAPFSQGKYPTSGSWVSKAGLSPHRLHSLPWLSCPQLPDWPHPHSCWPLYRLAFEHGEWSALSIFVASLALSSLALSALGFKSILKTRKMERKGDHRQVTKEVGGKEPCILITGGSRKPSFYWSGWWPGDKWYIACTIHCSNRGPCQYVCFWAIIQMALLETALNKVCL